MVREKSGRGHGPSAAERGGFEPPNEVNPRYAISSRARSTAPAPLRAPAKPIAAHGGAKAAALGRTGSRTGLGAGNPTNARPLDPPDPLAQHRHLPAAARP